VLTVLVQFRTQTNENLNTAGCTSHVEQNKTTKFYNCSTLYVVVHISTRNFANHLLVKEKQLIGCPHTLLQRDSEWIAHDNSTC